MTSTFEDRLLKIQEDLSQRGKLKEELLEQYVANRLASSLQTYYKELEQSVSYLEARKSESVISRL